MFSLLVLFELACVIGYLPLQVVIKPNGTN